MCTAGEVVEICPRSLAGAAPHSSAASWRLAALFPSPLSVASDGSRRANPTGKQRALTYQPPSALADLHILDLVELSGTQDRAAVAMNLHQSTVSRSVRQISREFRLVPGQPQFVCRYGHNECLHYLRLAYREHRLMQGLLRIGSDMIHQALLSTLKGLLPAPVRFRPAGHWAELIRNGLLDGAVVSGWCLDRPATQPQLIQWEGVNSLALGDLPLQLVANDPRARQIMVPPLDDAPALHHTLAGESWQLLVEPRGCHDQNAWVRRAQKHGCAIPICAPLLPEHWLEQRRLVPLVDAPALRAPLWFLMPQAAGPRLRLWQRMGRSLKKLTADAAAGS